MADTSTTPERIADKGRKTYEFFEGQRVPVGKSKFQTFKTKPGSMDDPGVNRGRSSTQKKKDILEQL